MCKLFKSEFRSTLFVICVIEFIFIGVVIGLEYSSSLGGLAQSKAQFVMICYVYVIIHSTYLPLISQMGLSHVVWLVCPACPSEVASFVADRDGHLATSKYTR